jgi:NADPH:quinone reductase
MSVADRRSGRSVFTDHYGPPDSYVLRSVPVPAPGPGEIRVAIKARGVGFVDLLIASGKYQVRPPLPYVPGTEFSGVIDSVGQGVRADRIGERVVAAALGGGFSDFAVLPERAATAIPSSMPFDVSLAFGASYGTAYHALVQRAGLAAGEWVLVLGAGGSIGIAAIQIAAALGARVIASTRGEKKNAAVLSNGASAVVDACAADWRERLRHLTGGAGIDVVVDPVGGPQSALAFRSLSWRGRLLVIGYACGEIPSIATNLALLKGAALVGVDIRQFSEREPELAAANLQRLFFMYGEGRLHPLAARRFPLVAFQDACAVVQRGENVGRIVLMDT